jgi:hypothetical protein
MFIIIVRQGLFRETPQLILRQNPGDDTNFSITQTTSAATIKGSLEGLRCSKTSHTDTFQPLLPDALSFVELIQLRPCMPISDRISMAPFRS